MAYDFLERCNTKKLKERGDYGVRVARPGFDASNCADNQLIFNSGWPILQLCAVIDFDKATDTYTRYLLPNGTWSDTLPSGYTDMGPTWMTDRFDKIGVNKNYCRKFVSARTYMNTSTWQEATGVTYKRMRHYLGYTPFFIPADDVTGTTSNKVLLFSVEIETDVDYPYTDAALPMVSIPDDYGMKSSSIFGPRVPGLSTGQFSKLVQAVKTQETAKYTEETSGTKMPYWSPLSDAPNSTPSKSPLLPFEAFGFAIKGFYTSSGTVAYDEKDGGYYTPIYARAIADGGSSLAYVYSLQALAEQYFRKSSLVIFRSPLVSPEYEEIDV
jgi:hypothetical protein